MEEAANNTLMQLGIGALLIWFVYMMLKEMFTFLLPLLKGRNENGREKHAPDGITQKDIADLESEVHDLWVWHNVKNLDGVFVWYVRRSLEDAISMLATNTEAQTKILQELVMQNREVCSAIDRMERRRET